MPSQKYQMREKFLSHWNTVVTSSIVNLPILGFKCAYHARYQQIYDKLLFLIQSLTHSFYYKVTDCVVHITNLKSME